MMLGEDLTEGVAFGKTLEKVEAMRCKHEDAWRNNIQAEVQDMRWEPNLHSRNSKRPGRPAGRRRSWS